MRETATTATEVELDVSEFLRSLLRKLPYIIVFAAIVAVGTYVFLSSIDPRYSAETTVLIETSETSLTLPTGTTSQPTAEILDQQAIASQVQLILSRDLARTVAERLDLASRAEFDPSRGEPSLIDRLLGMVGIGGEPDDSRVAERVLGAYYERLSVYNVSNSRVIAIDFTATDPELAAAVANAIAEEYLVLQSQAKRDNTSEAVAWLSDQIADLSGRVQEAEARTETFRSENDLFSTGTGTTTTTLSQQQLADLSAELTRVRAQRADAEARAAQIKAGLDSGVTPNQSEVVSSPLIQRLIEQQVQLRAEIAQLSATYLPQHPRMQEMQAQLADLDRQVAGETRKVLASVQAEAELARGREAEINAELSRMKVSTAEANNAEVQLRALEREAAAQRDLLDSYLRRYREALAREQSGFLPADARIISRATTPIAPSFPKKLPLTAAATLAAILLALGIVFLRELTTGRALRPVAVEPPPLVPDALPVEGHSRWADDRGVRRMMTSDPTIAPEVMDRVEESLTSIVSQIVARKHRRVLVTLAEGSDESGRPLAAVALARALARLDIRTVLVDLREDGANAAAMGEKADLPGVTDVIAGDASFAQAIFRDRKSRVHFVPTGRGKLDAVVEQEAQLDQVISALAMTYDVVVLDASDPLIAQLAGDCNVAVVVSEFNEADPRTLGAFERISSTCETPTLLLVVDPVPESAEAGAKADGEVA